MSIFIDREKELKILRERYFSKNPEFLIIYGRRRIGKSELVDQFIKSKDIIGIRLLAREESKYMQLKRFKEKLATFFKDLMLEKMEFQDWDSFFEYLYEKTKNKRVVIAIDEFPYLIKEDKSLPSILQAYWDEKLRKTKIFLILLGSSVSMMEKLLGYKSPLYGRRTGQIKLKPLSFVDVFNYIGDLKKSVEVYSVFGGTPLYITEIKKEKTIWENIRQNFLKEDSFVYRDVEFLLREEINEPRYYFSILLSISRGNNKIGHICQDTGLNKGIVVKYLSVLIDLGFVKRITPITESYKSKKGLYFIEDNLFDFYFRFVYPNIELIEQDMEDVILNNHIKPYFNEFVGKKFEDVILEISRKLWPSFSKVGKWWHKDREIDMVALNEREKKALFGEVKWKAKVDAKKVVKGLVEKAEYVKWYNGDRKEAFAVFARSFKKKIDEFEGKKVYCFDLKYLEKMLKECVGKKKNYT